jgi:hypothetical protein
MFERKLGRDRVRPFHPPVHAGHPARDDDGTRPEDRRRKAEVGRQPRRCAARRVWRILAGSEQRASKGARVRGPGHRRCAERCALRCPSSRSDAGRTHFFAVATNASKTSVAMNPSPPWPAEGSPASRLDRERRRSGGGTERSSLATCDGSGGMRARSSHTGMLAHGVRDASATGAIPRSKDLEEDQSPGRVGRKAAGNGGHRYGLNCGATPRR